MTTREKAETRIARLRDEIRRHEHLYYALEPSRDLRPGVRRAREGAARARGAVPRPGHARQPHPARGRAALRGVPELRAPGADAEPRQHLLGGGAAGVRGADLPGGGEARDRLHRGAEDRRAVDVAALRGRSPRPGGHARGRRARRRRDAEREGHPGDPARAPGSRRAVGARGARGGVLPPQPLRGDEPRAGGVGGGAVRQPAQRRGGDDEEPRRAGGREAGPRRVPLCHRPRQGRFPAQPVGGAPGAALLGAAHQPDLAAVPGARRGAGVHRGVAREAREPRVRDRRGRHQGRRLRPPAGARLHVEVPPLGDRLQVPGDAGGDDGARRSRCRWAAPAS